MNKTEDDYVYTGSGNYPYQMIPKKFIKALDAKKDEE